MIIGIGIDVVSIERIGGIHERWGGRFLHKVFTAEELECCMANKDPNPSLAARFAAREALGKALGIGLRFSFKDVEVANDANGMPLIRLKGEFAEYVGYRGVKNIHISMSHEKEYAAAMVVLEG